MSLIDTVIARIAPHECLKCAKEGHLLCSGCIQKLFPARHRCYRCQGSSEGFYTCNNCLQLTPLTAVRSAALYKTVVKDQIWKFKSSGAQSAAKVMAAQMLPLLCEADLSGR